MYRGVEISPVQMVTTIEGARVTPDELGAVIAAYFALEEARACRRLLVVRFGMLAAALGVIGFGFHWLSPIDSWIAVGLCGVAPAWAWVAEGLCNWKLSTQLNALPPGSTHTTNRPRP
jgi:hypothetical protein